jgi:hypothetical protein
MQILRASVVNFLAGSVAVASLLAASQSAQSTSVSVSAEAPSALLPSLPLATVLTFDDLPVGSLSSYRFRGGTLSGSGAEEDTSLVGEYAQPAGDATGFLTVSYPYPSGAVNLVFTNPENYFGLYWGSMDSYNSVTFLKNAEQIATYSGTHIARLTGLVANGQQQSVWSNRYIEFNFGTDLYDQVILSTTDFGFEVDNIAFGDPPSPVSEPDTRIVLVSSVRSGPRATPQVSVMSRALRSVELRQTRGYWDQLFRLSGRADLFGTAGSMARLPSISQPYVGYGPPR